MKGASPSLHAWNHMLRICLSLALAWAFAWRFVLVACLQAYGQYRFINVVGLRMEQTTESLLFLLFVASILAFSPFLITMYWLVARGVLLRITIRYAQKITDRKHKYLWRAVDYVWQSIRAWIHKRRTTL